MAKALKILDAIDVSVQLEPAFRQFASPDTEEGKTLRSCILRSLQEILDELAIPVELSLNVTSDEDGGSFATGPYRVFIGSQPCRLNLQNPVRHDAEPVELARAISRTIHENRELLITPSLIEKIKRQWFSEFGDDSLNKLPDLTKQLVRRSISIAGGKYLGQIIEARGSDELDMDATFEDIISRAVKLKLLVSKGLHDYMSDPAEDMAGQAKIDDMRIEEMLSMMSDGLFYELGLFVPAVSLDIDESLKGNEFRLQLNDLRLPPLSGLAGDQFLVNDTVESLSQINIKGEPAINPANGNECALVRNENNAVKICMDRGLTIWGPAAFAVLSISAEIRRNAGALLTVEVVKYNINRLYQIFPALVAAALQRFDIVKLTQILRELLDEEIPVRDLRGILETLLNIKGTTDVDLSKYIAFLPYTANLCPAMESKTIEDLDAADYSNCVRMAFKRHISYKYTNGGNTLVVYLMDPQIEARIRESNEQPLTREEQERFTEVIHSEVANVPASPKPVILTSVEVRRNLRKLIEKEFPGLAVLSYQELSPYINIQPIARISWD